jgi:hypothetical protein
MNSLRRADTRPIMDVIAELDAERPAQATAPCPLCGKALEFSTDGNGRLLEGCPERRCKGHRVHETPRGVTRPPLLEELTSQPARALRRTGPRRIPHSPNTPKGVG